MSLVGCVRTAHGIVLSADRRLSFDFVDDKQAPAKIIRRKVITDQEQKLFSVGAYGLSFFGDSGSVPMSALLERAITRIDVDQDLNIIARMILDEIHRQLPPGTNALFYLCGYDVSFPDGGNAFM